VVPKPVALAKAPSFLTSACSFQRPITPATSTIPKKTPLEVLHDELNRYLCFEAVPVLRGEGDPEGKGLGVSEPSAEEVC